MKLSTTTRAAAISAALAGSLALAACGASNEGGSDASSEGSGSSSSAPQLSGSLSGAGSSAQQAAMQAWTAGFNGSQPGVTVNYDPVGSGGGRTQFLDGGVAFAGSDAAMTDEEITKAATQCGTDGVFELPNYVSAIAVAFNVEGVKSLNLSPDTLGKIFSGTITKWNDPAIAADNKDAKLPDLAITAVHRGDKSGTTKNFTDYLSKAASSSWTAGAVEEWPAQGGEAATGTSGVVQALKAGNGTIGYADESQVKGLGIAKVKVGSDWVAPSAEAAAAVVANSPRVEGRGDFDFAVNVNRTPTSAEEYPVVLVSYHIGCVTYKDKTTADLVKAFEGYVISKEGQEAAAKNAGSSPISDEIRANSQKAVDAIKSGS
ncbi:phosphate ABC transporter substrate-binding protein PstS [Modestobacter sp. NPDC049651]|uniref:phosphate ABC transporter substrate-binding protein PstS n=1 Tax=unclassified Modestobacter TaxID=2643866 RepID=UPI0033E896C5